MTVEIYSWVLPLVALVSYVIGIITEKRLSKNKSAGEILFDDKSGKILFNFSIMPEDLNGMRSVLMDVRHVTMSDKNNSPDCHGSRTRKKCGALQRRDPGKQTYPVGKQDDPRGIEQHAHPVGGKASDEQRGSGLGQQERYHRRERTQKPHRIHGAADGLIAGLPEQRGQPVKYPGGYINIYQQISRQQIQKDQFVPSFLKG